jgi:hypothetical protein
MVYHWLLRLYPYDFRRQYQDELEADFEIARQEAMASGGRTALVTCYMHAAADLALTLPREWLRTPWIPVLMAAVTIASGVFYYVVIRVYRAGSFENSVGAIAGRPIENPPESPALLLLMAAMVLVPVCCMVLIGIVSRVSTARPLERRGRVRG